MRSLQVTTRAALCTLGLLVAGPAVAWAQEPAPPPEDTPRQAPTEVPNPRRLKFVAPEYPPEAVVQGLRGIVILELVVDTRGKVASVEVVRSVPPFDDPAVKAVRQWEYEITRVDGKPVPVRLTLPITFAVKMPEIARDPGIPELIRGVGPPFPAGAGAHGATVKAEVTLDADGNVVEAHVTSGDSPWAEAMIQAVRSWRFAAPGGEGNLAVEAQAEFIPSGKDAPRVALQLRRPRRVAAAVPADHAAVPAAAPSPVPTPPAAATAPPAAAPSPAAPPPSVQAVVGVPSPAPAAAPTAEPSAPPSPSAGTPTPPPVEVLPAPGAPPPSAAPAAPARPTEGVSAVRDVALAPGIPDLASGRRPMVPPFARMSGTSGQVVVRFAVDAAGITGSLQVEGPETLKEAARQTVASWTFRRDRADRIYLRAVLTYEGDTARARVERAE